MNAEWSIEADSVPAQTNGVDCGFFTIMFILHLLYFDHLNAADCPPGLRISGGTKMAATRVWLATKLIEWCSQNSSTAKKEPKSSAPSNPSSSPSSPPTPMIVQLESTGDVRDGAVPTVAATEIQKEPTEPDFDLDLEAMAEMDLDPLADSESPQAQKTPSPVPTSDLEEEELQVAPSSSPLTSLPQVYQSFLPRLPFRTIGEKILLVLVGEREAPK
ncbi:hypothetical protein B0H16DRAFT_619004 [Mycena metata]|uniref:Uncharacterized protein n=1 Tax=Mycena metata TaxID=1033252 RepID=A0AAD7KED2_9AGAR|nr:hypothetical protein B0H16DRAFT_619004 [Mycena metata]